MTDWYFMKHRIAKDTSPDECHLIIVDPKTQSQKMEFFWMRTLYVVSSLIENFWLKKIIVLDQKRLEELETLVEWQIRNHHRLITEMQTMWGKYPAYRTFAVIQRIKKHRTRLTPEIIKVAGEINEYSTMYPFINPEFMFNFFGSAHIILETNICFHTLREEMPITPAQVKNLRELFGSLVSASLTMQSQLNDARDTVKQYQKAEEEELTENTNRRTDW
jgi:hypothetical protein